MKIREKIFEGTPLVLKNQAPPPAEKNCGQKQKFGKNMLLIVASVLFFYIFI